MLQFKEERGIPVRRILGFLTVYDKIFMGAVIGISAIFIILPLTGLISPGGGDGDKVAVVQAGQEVVRRIPLEDTYTEPVVFSVEGPLGPSVIEAESGEVRLKEAPEEDPLKICEKTGWIKIPGPTIVCVPNEISIWIETVDPDLDGVSR
ncbi:MAG: NusG domain II-containing protein [Halanaerobiales bacterium]